MSSVLKKMSKSQDTRAHWEVASGETIKSVLMRHVGPGAPHPRDTNGDILHHGRHETDDINEFAEDTADSAGILPLSVCDEPLPVDNNMIAQHNESPVCTSDCEITANGQVWKSYNDDDHINGMVRCKRWEVKCSDGSMVSEGSEWRERKPIDYFLMMFPMAYMPAIVNMTSKSLEENGHNNTTVSEILGFFGVLVLMTRFEFSGSRRFL